MIKNQEKKILSMKGLWLEWVPLKTVLFLLAWETALSCQMQADDWTLICLVLTFTKLDWPVNYLKIENHVLLFFLHAPESSMVLDTKSMASKYLLGKCQPSPQGNCLNWQVIPLPHADHRPSIWKILDHFASCIGGSFKLKCYNCNQGRRMVYRWRNSVTEG